jgi:hypothetical protein
MKKHLVNLLLEQFKQDYLVSRLDELGIEMQVPSVDITPIVYDLVGLPADNTADYCHPSLEGTPNANGKKKYDEEYCSREWLIDKYYESISPILKEVDIKAMSKGLTFVISTQEEEVREILSTFVDWLYEQVEIINSAKLVKAY